MQEESRLINSGPAANHRRLFLSAASAFFVLASSALAQAWLAPKGEASFGAAYQNLYTRDHLFSRGEVYDAGRIRMQMLVFGLSYSFTDRLAAAASVPYVSTRYDGTRPHVAPGFKRVDDGSYHGTFTDLRVELRYNLLRDPAMVTPFVSAIIPTHDYPTFPVIRDPRGELARLLDARRTPEAFVLDQQGRLRYHGRIASKLGTPDLRNALDAFLAGRPIHPAETKSFGCSIDRS